MEYLIVLILGLLGFGVYNHKKRQSAEALLQNTDLKEELNNKDKDILKDQAELSLEEQKRKEALEKIKKPNEQNIVDLINFINDKFK